MKALVWHGTRDVTFEDAPSPSARRRRGRARRRAAPGSAAPTCTATAGIPGRACRRSCSGTRSSGSVGGADYAVYPLIGCGECEHCLAGEDNLLRVVAADRDAPPGRLRRARGVARRSRLVPLPDGIDHERAVLVEPLACCVGALAPHCRRRAVRRRARLRAARAADASISRARAGAHVTAVDPLAERRAIAERLGAGDDRGRARAGRLRPRRRRGRLRADVARGARGRALRRDGRDARARQRRGDVPDGAARPPRGRRCAGSSPTRAPSSRARSRSSPRATCRSTGSRPRRSSEGADAFANLVDRPAEFAKVVLTPA